MPGIGICRFRCREDVVVLVGDMTFNIGKYCCTSDIAEVADAYQRSIEVIVVECIRDNRMRKIGQHKSSG